jgi:hypothetical protein
VSKDKDSLDAYMNRNRGPNQQTGDSKKEKSGRLQKDERREESRRSERQEEEKKSQRNVEPRQQQQVMMQLNIMGNINQNHMIPMNVA